MTAIATTPEDVASPPAVQSSASRSIAGRVAPPNLLVVHTGNYSTAYGKTSEIKNQSLILILIVHYLAGLESRNASK